MTYSNDLLEIPEFLRRTRKRGRPRKIVSEVSKENNWEEWSKEKQSLYGTRNDIVLQDEAPSIGSGYRVVYVKEGRKWAHITNHDGDPANKEYRIRRRITLKKWNKLKASHKRYVARNGEIGKQ